MKEVMTLLDVSPPRPNELDAALVLILQHGQAAEKQACVANARLMIQNRELNPEGIWVARQDGKLLGALLCQVTAGAGGLFWPPQVVPSAGAALVEDQLIQHALLWLERQGVKLVQALLPRRDLPMGTPLLRHGFNHVTRLVYMRHDLDTPVRSLPGLDDLRLESAAEAKPDVFQQTLIRTYESSLDCPEINGVRSPEEILAAHRAQGQHDPRKWWLANDGTGAVGILLLAQLPESLSWELAYLGIVPEARRRGLGSRLVGQAIREARAAGSLQLTISVDTRNAPALRLYRKWGFSPYDHSEIFLAILAT
jgi:ribosomal protein S18 acetylase RimI-like enzyme